MQEITKEANARMLKSLDTFKHELTKVRTGRASPALLDHVKVISYGTEMPLNQVANITAENARTLLITPWDKSSIPVIEKAIIAANLGLNPTTSGTVIRVPMPALNEERRKELVKMVRDETENARVAMRNIRRDANQASKDLLKEKKINEDEERRMQTEIQKLTDKLIAEVDKTLAGKEAELMEV